MIVEWGAPSFDAKLPAGQWSHIAGTVDADGVLALYVNGKQVAVTKPLTAPPAAPGYPSHCIEAAFQRLAGTF